MKYKRNNIYSNIYRFENKYRDELLIKADDWKEVAGKLKECQIDTRRWHLMEVKSC
jgi:hypothetical protein